MEIEDIEIEILNTLRGKIYDLLVFCESPIEKKFILEFLLYFSVNGGFEISIESKTVITRNITITLQYNIKRNIRVDFLIFLGSSKMLAIECDGHEFHEKTKEQAQRDKSRDRTIQSEGFSILRFTGSEIYNNMPFVIQEIISFLIKE